MINRNNYEEYFLLLADNELSADEAASVKRFAAQHPDLAEELDMLLSCRLEDISMPVFPKDKLLRPVLWEAEHPEPIQTQLLLLLDGELPRVEKQQLEEKIVTDTLLQTEWKLLQQSQLPAEAIVHPDKESLQRNEQKVRPLRWMHWVAAAAVVTGLGWMFWLQQAPKAVNPTALASNTTPAQKRSTTKPFNTQLLPEKEETAVMEPETSKPSTLHRVSAPHSTEAAPDKTMPHLATNKSQIISTRSLQNEPNEAEPVAARLNGTVASLDIDEQEPDASMQVAHLSTKNVALPALIANQQTESFNGSKSDLAYSDDDYVTVGAAHINKQKMRGLFRNVTRTVARSFTKSKMEPDVYATR